MKRAFLQSSYFLFKVVYISADIKFELCSHPKCGAKMQRLYKRVNGKFALCAWLCPDCKLVKTNDIRALYPHSVGR